MREQYEELDALEAEGGEVEDDHDAGEDLKTTVPPAPSGA